MLIPPVPDSGDSEPQFILASRLQPEFSETSLNSSGVQQIVVLPKVGKACVLCNGTLTFYSLPEFSPAYGGSAKVGKCAWIGGVDEENLNANPNEEGALLMVCVEKRILFSRIGERARKALRNIELPGYLKAVRRGTIACVADSRSYSLLEVVEQQKIPLFEINPQREQENQLRPENEEKSLPPSPNTEEFPIPNSSEDSARLAESAREADVKEDDDVGERPQADLPPRTSSLAPNQNEASSSTNTDKEPPQSTHSRQSSTIIDSKSTSHPLQPNIISSTESEFLLTTGTSINDPGVGIFVNLDGDVVRGTLQFSRYPESIVTDGHPDEGGSVLAVINHDDDGTSKMIEIHRFDKERADGSLVHQLDPRTLSSTPATTLGLHHTESQTEIVIGEIVNKIRLTPLEIQAFSVGAPRLASIESREQRQASELQFATQLSRKQANLVTWTSNSIWWIVRSPQVLRLDSKLDQAVASAPSKDNFADRRRVEEVLRAAETSDSKDDAQSALDFLGTKYIRQKVSLILFCDLLKQTSSGLMSYERDRAITEKLLAEGDIDPRIIIACIDGLHDDIRVDNLEGLWVQAGLHEVYKAFDRTRIAQPPMEIKNVSWENLLHVVKRYLMHWRQQKGYASVTNDRTLFQSVDIALLHILLALDCHGPPGRAIKGSTRAELNAVVDEGLEDFDRAVQLLEQYQRMYTLSRFYQGRRQYAKVLETWKRVVDGECDRGEELGNGEEEIRDYLTKRKDRALVQEYGRWLALHNPRLGVQIFADPKSQIKFEPKEVIEMLEESPNAVKEYLEQLVFKNNVSYRIIVSCENADHKQLSQYANDLIGYYLDSVLQQLDTSHEARSTLATSYEAYRALTPPKPTYSQFATDNLVDSEWWRNRLRLLQLLGDSHSAASQYDTRGILDRIASYRELLVPETIILSGRRGRHDEALRLLTHGLGDFDTAVSYCVLGGSSTYSPIGNNDSRPQRPSHREQMRLFRCLLTEFLDIRNMNDRITQTSELLDRFSGWFDINDVG